MTTVPQNLDRVASLIHAKLEMRIAKANSFRRKPRDRHDCYKTSGHMRRGNKVSNRRRGSHPGMDGTLGQPFYHCQTHHAHWPSFSSTPIRRRLKVLESSACKSSIN